MLYKLFYSVVMAAVCFLSISILISMNLSDKELMASLFIAPFVCLVISEVLMSGIQVLVHRCQRR